MPTSRRDWLRTLLTAAPAAALTSCVSTGGGIGLDGTGRRNAAKWEFQERFLASGARFRYHPYGGQGRAWTSQMEYFYRRHRTDPRIGYAVKNLHTGHYHAQHQADRLFMGGSMPKPPIAAMLLEKRQGACSYEEFMHIVQVLDKSVNASWMALQARLTPQDEASFKWRYRLPHSNVLGNQLTPRFYAEFFERCVNYRLAHGSELLVEGMRRDQYGFGRLYLPTHLSFAGGKTGNYGQWDHEALFFYHGATPYAITLFTSGDFSPGKSNVPLGAMIGGLYREFVA